MGVDLKTIPKVFQNRAFLKPFFNMESSEQVSSNPDSPHQRWAGILGSIIAVITLTLPFLTIVYYSSLSINAEPLSERIYTLPNRE